MRIHYCLACGFNKFFLGIKINRFRCRNPETRRKNNSYRILNKELIMRGHFPKWCTLEDCKSKGYIEYEKTNHPN